MRRATRIALLLAGALLLAPLLLGGALLLFANTDAGRHLIESWTARLSGGTVRIEGLTGPLPGRIGLQHLALSDDHGAWLQASGLELRWSPLHLLLWRIDIDSLSAARLEVERAPRSKPTSARSRGAPSLPPVNLHSLTVRELGLGAALAGEPSVLAVEGSGQYQDLRHLAARVQARRLGGEGHYQVAVHSDARGLQAQVRLAEPAGGPLEHLAGLPGLGALSATLDVEGPHEAEQIALALTAGELRASAQGRLDLGSLAADLELGITAPAMRPAPQLAWEGLSVQGRWQGPLASARAHGHVVVLGLSAGAGVRIAKLLTFFDAGKGLLRAHGSIEGLELPGSQPRLFADAPIELGASLGLDAPSRPATLSLHHPALELDAHGTLAAPQRIEFALNTAQIAPFAALAGQDLAGDAHLEGSLYATASRLDAQLRAHAGLRGSSLAARLLGSDARLALRAQLAGRELSVRELRADGTAVALAARGTLTRAAAGGAALEHLRLQGSLELPRLELLAAQLEGSLRAGVSLEGPPDSLAAELHLGSQLSVRGSPPGKLEAVLRARGLPAAATGTLQAHGSFDGAPVRIAASLERREPGTAHLVLHQTAWKSLQASADVTSGAELARARGSLELHIGRLADLERLLGPDLQGRVDASLALGPGRQGTEARVQLHATDLHAGSIGGELHLAGSGPTTALQLLLQARSPQLGGGPVSLDARARADLLRRSLDLDAASAAVHGQTVRLLAPAHLETRPAVRIDALRLGAGKAELVLAGTLAPQLELQAQLHDPDAQLVDAFAPDLIDEGRFEASAELHGSPTAPLGQARLSISGLKLANENAEGLPATDLELRATLQGKTAAVDARLVGGRAARAQLTGTVPLAAAGTLDLALTGRIDAAIANPLLEAQGRRAAGTLTVDVRARGPLSAPQLSGLAQLVNGDLRDYAQGVHIGSITARLTGEQGRLRLVSLSGRAGPGELSASGTLGVLEPRLPVELAIRARHAQPVNSDILTANVDADLTVKGSLRERLDLTGRIEVNRAEVGIPNGLPPNVAVLDVRRRGAPAQDNEEDTQRVIGLALSVHAPRQVLVRGRGLDAELGGDVTIGGTSQDPEVSGGFHLIRGTFALASTQLQFSRGEVSFNGAGLRGRIDPTLDFAAQSQVADTTVQLAITGLADAPSFELSSTPQLPQDEILARLLFGQSAAQLSALQVAQIGAALASLSGVGGGGSGLNPLARLQKTLGLDRLSVGGAGNAGGATPQGPAQQSALGATVTAGRYVSPRVFVAASQSTTGASQLQVDVDLTRRLKLRTRLGNGTATAQGTTPENDPGSSIGLSWQYEY